MLQLDLITGHLAGTSVQPKHFPFRVGRAAHSDLRLEETGVWDDHVEIQLRVPHFVLELKPGASILVNGIAAGPAPMSLANGDVITLGVVQLRFGLIPPRQKSLTPRELLTWSLLASIVLGQVALIYWLMGQ